MAKQFCLGNLEELREHETSKNESPVCSHRTSVLTSRSLIFHPETSLAKASFVSPKIVRASHEIVFPEENSVITTRGYRRSKTVMLKTRIISENLLLDRLEE